MPKRKQLRLKEYDYASCGFYFVTICTHDRKMHFKEHPMLEEIVKETWFELEQLFSGIRMDEFVVMPNHIHGIIEILPVGAGLVPALNHNRAATRAAPTIGNIIGTFKSLFINRWLKFITSTGLNMTCKFWQRNYYERIIRNDEELNAIRQYIRDNPIMWESDTNNPANKQ